MYNMKEEIIRYVENEKKKGYDNYVIMKALLVAGYTEDEIHEAIHDVDKNRNMVRVSIFSGILILIIVAVAFFMHRMNSYSTENVEYEFTSENTAALKQAFKSGDITQCDNTGSLKPMCIGIVNSDLDSCKIMMGSFAESCMIMVARKTRNANICGQIIKAKGTCYLLLAIDTKDKNLCHDALEYESYCNDAI
jgi:hypothetical protein